METFSQNHSKDTALKDYVSDELKQQFALTAHSWYRGEVDNEDDFFDNQNAVFISDEQDKRFEEGDQMLEESDMNDYIELVRERDDGCVPTREKFVTNSLKVALLETIVKASEEKLDITSRGTPTSILLTGTPAYRKNNISLLLRLLDLTPDSWQCRMQLEENLLLFASFEAETPGVTVRQVEENWSQKMLKCSDFIHRGSDFRILHVFMDLHKRHGNTFTLGNEFLCNQLSQCMPEADKRSEASRNK